MNTNIKKLTQILKESNNIVFFGGAGRNDLTAGTGNRGLSVFGMNIFFHGVHLFQKSKR